MSGVVLDAETGEETPITSRNLKEVYEGLRSGKAVVTGNVNVVDKSGSLFELDPTNPEQAEFLKTTLAGGNEFRLATQPEIQNVADQAEFGDRPLASGAYGLAEGVAPGLATLGLEALGVEARTLKGLKEQGETAFNVGQVTGFLLPAAAAVKAVSGAAKGVGLGAKLLSATPTGQITKLGIAAEEFTRKLLPGAAAETFLARAAGQAGALAGAGAVEGALFGVGDAIRETALGNVEFAAESLGTYASYIGGGALFGAVGGGGIGLVSEAGRTLLSRAGSKLVKGDIVAEEAVDGAKILVKNGMGQELTDEAAEVAVRATLVDRGREGLGDLAYKMAKGAGVDEETAAIAKRVATDSDFARMATKSKEVTEAKLPELKKDFDFFEEQAHRARDFGSLEMKQELFRKHADIPLTPEAAVKSRELMDEAWALALRMEKATGDFLAGPAYGKKLRAVLQSIETRIDTAPKYGKAFVSKPKKVKRDGIEFIEYPKDGLKIENFSDMRDLTSDFTIDGAVHQVAWLDELKRRVGHIRTSTQNPNVKEAMGDLYHKLQDHLTDKTYFGGMAKAQEDVNKYWAEFLETNDAFSAHFLADSGRRMHPGDFENFYEMDPKKLTQWAKDTGTFESSRIDGIMDRRIEAERKLFAELGKYYDVPPAMAKTVNEAMPEAAKRLKQRLTEVRETVGAKNALERLRSATQASTLGRLASVGGAGLGFAAGGVTGGLAGALAGQAASGFVRSLLLDPATLASVAHSGGVFPKALLTVAGAMASTLRGVSGATTGILRFAEKPRSFPLAVTFTAAELPKRYRESVEAVLEAVENPGGLADSAAVDASGLEVEAPGVAIAVQQKSQQNVEFLASKIPAESLPSSGRQDPDGKKVLPASTLAMQRYMRYVEAVRRPGTVLKNLQNTGTAYSEEIEVLKTLKPHIWKLLQHNTLIEMRPKKGRKKLSSIQRRRIGNMLDMELDDLNNPELFAISQYERTEEEQTTQGGQSGVRSKRIAKFRRSETDLADSEQNTRFD